MFIGQELVQVKSQYLVKICFPKKKNKKENLQKMPRKKYALEVGGEKVNFLQTCFGKNAKHDLCLEGEKKGISVDTICLGQKVPFCFCVKA